MASFSKEDQRSIEFIWSWYEDQKAGLFDYRNKIFRLFVFAPTILDAKFIGLTTDEFNLYFDESERELEHLVCFDLISATEAKLKNDFYNRIKKKKRNCDITDRFREIHKEKGDKVSLEQDIISVWKEELILEKAKFSNYIGLLNYRHWLAHGRYWTPNIGQDYDPLISYNISDKIFKILDSK